MLSLKKIYLSEMSLYHGTINDHKDSVEKIGLVGGIGDWVEEAYGIDMGAEGFTDEEIEERMGDIVFAADKSSMDSATGAIRFHVGKKLDKYLSNVTEEDMEKHGMLVVIKDVEVAPELSQLGDAPEEGEWYHRPEEDYYGNYPISVEPGDYFFKGDTGIDFVLIGKKMMDFLRRHGALNYVYSDERRQLIKMMVALYGPQEREMIIKQVKELDDMKLSGALWKIREEGGEEAVAKKKEKRLKPQGDKRQLSFSFDECRLLLRKNLL